MNPGGTVPCARGYHSLTTVGAYAVLFGGKGDAGIVKEDCLSIYDVMKNKWIIPKVQGDAPLPRSNHAATLMDPDLIIIHGGRHGSLRLSDTYVLQVPWSSAYSISNLYLRWHVLEKSVNTRQSLGKSTLNAEPDSPHGRSAHGLVARDRALYLFGGYGGQGLTFNDIFILRNFPSLSGLEQPNLDGPVSSDAQAPICITDNSDEENGQCWRSTKRQKQQSYQGHKSLSGLQEVGHNLKQRLHASLSRNRDAEDTGRIMLKSVDSKRQQSSHVTQVQAVETQEDTVLKMITKEKEALEKEVVNLRQEIESLKANITEKTCIEDGLRVDKLHLEKEITSLNERKGDLSKVIRVLEKKVQLSNEKTRDLEYQNQNMKTQIQALRTSLDEKEKKNVEVAQEAKDAQNKCEELKVSLDNVRSFSTDVVHERDEYKACVEKLKLELEKQMQSLQQLNLKFESEKTFLLCEVAERKATTDRLLTELGMSKESTRALRDTIDRQAKQLQDENNKQSVLQKEKEELSQSNAVLVAENKQLFAARESAHANFVFLKSELQSTRALYEQNVAEVGRLQKHVEQSKEHIASLHESLKKNEENMRSKDQELSRLRALINEVEQFERVQMTTLQQHLEKLKCV